MCSERAGLVSDSCPTLLQLDAYGLMSCKGKEIELVL